MTFEIMVILFRSFIRLWNRIINGQDGLLNLLFYLLENGALQIVVVQWHNRADNY